MITSCSALCHCSGRVRPASSIAFLLVSLLASSLVSLLVISTCCRPRPLQNLGHWNQFRILPPHLGSFQVVAGVSIFLAIVFSDSLTVGFLEIHGGGPREQGWAICKKVRGDCVQMSAYLHLQLLLSLSNTSKRTTRTCQWVWSGLGFRG